MLLKYGIPESNFALNEKAICIYRRLSDLRYLSWYVLKYNFSGSGNQRGYPYCVKNSLLNGSKPD
ncbi:MAG: hypothetical protein ACXVB6_09500, partial [Mucilaginibacter sp.]